MGNQSAEEMLLELGRSGYFSQCNYNGCHCYSESSLKKLFDAGYVIVKYDPDPSIHPREKFDCWSMVLLPVGEELLTAHHVVYSADCVADSKNV